MQRFIAQSAFAIVVLTGSSSFAQNIATGSATIPAAGRAGAAPSAAAQPPRPAAGMVTDPVAAVWAWLGPAASTTMTKA